MECSEEGPAVARVLPNRSESSAVIIVRDGVGGHRMIDLCERLIVDRFVMTNLIAGFQAWPFDRRSWSLSWNEYCRPERKSSWADIRHGPRRQAIALPSFERSF